MDIAIEIVCSMTWTTNPLALQQWAEVPSPRFATPEAALLWLARRGAVNRPLRVVRVRPRSWGASNAAAFAIEARQF